MSSSIGYLGIDPTQTVSAADVAAGKSPHKLGTIAGHVDSTGANLVFKWVLYNDGSSVAAAAGRAAYYFNVDGHKNHEVTSDNSLSLGDSSIGSGGNEKQVGAGILKAAIEDGGHGWIQIKGPATMSITLEGTPGDGDPLCATVVTDGALRTVVDALDHKVGVAGDASDNEIICDFMF